MKTIEISDSLHSFMVENSLSTLDELVAFAKMQGAQDYIANVVKDFEANKKKDEGPFRTGLGGTPRVNFGWWAKNMFPVQPMPPGAQVIYSTEMEDKTDE